jgi:hypothetical protein
VAKSAAEAIVATAMSITADAATTQALQLVDEGAAGAQPTAAAHAAPGTHAVAVRIDRDSHEFVLSCESCSWEADRGPDSVHSWSARSLELTLLHHIDFESQASSELPTPAASTQSRQQERAPVGRRSLLRPRGWVA